MRAGQARRAAPPPHAAEMLAAGVQDITNSMVADDFRLNEVLRMVLETMYRALDFQRIVFCLRDPKTDLPDRSLRPRAMRVDALAARFRVPLRPTPGVPPDLFAAICAKGMDTLIADATGRAASRRACRPGTASTCKAPTFLLLPLAMKGATFGADLRRQGRRPAASCSTRRNWRCCARCATRP